MILKEKGRKMSYSTKKVEERWITVQKRWKKDELQYKKGGRKMSYSTKKGGRKMNYSTKKEKERWVTVQKRWKKDELQYKKEERKRSYSTKKKKQDELQYKKDGRKMRLKEIWQSNDYWTWKGRDKSHGSHTIPQYNMNICIQTKLVTAGEEATVHVWLSVTWYRAQIPSKNY